MALIITDIKNITIAGDTLGQGAGPFATVQQPVNTNGPPPEFAQLAIGSNTILVPSGFTVGLCTLITPSGSGNIKTILASDGLGVGLVGWTNYSPSIPVTAGGTFIILSTTTETIKLVWS